MATADVAQTMRGHITSARSHTDPLERITALTVVRDAAGVFAAELRTALAEEIRDARHDGRTWDEITERLGVTRTRAVQILQTLTNPPEETTRS